MKKTVLLLTLVLNLIFSNNYSLFFDGDGYVEIPAHSSYQIGSENFSIQLWAYMPASEDNLIGNTYQHFFSMVEQGDDFSLKAYRLDNDIYFWSPSYSTLGNVSATYVEDEYVNIALVRDGDIGRIYINGVEVLSKSEWTSSYSELQPIRFGWGHSNEWSYAYQKEVSFWNKNLTSEQIIYNMENSLIGNENGLIGYWPLNEGNGLTAYDHSEHQNHGSIFSATWAISPVIFSGCMDGFATNYNPEAVLDDASCEYPENGDYSLSFDGPGQSVIPGNLNIDGWTEGTIETMVKFNSNNWGTDGTWILNKSFEGTDNFGLGINSFTTANTSSISFGNYSDSWIFASSQLQPITGEWYHIVAKWDANNIKLFVDGEERGSNSSIDISNIGSLYIGNSSDDEGMFGNISYLNIWDKAIDVDELNNSYESNSGLRVNYKFNSGIGDILYDHSGNNNHGTIYGATWVENIEGCTDELACNYDSLANISDDSCDYNCHDNGDYSLSFDGVDDWVDIPSFDLDYPLTIEVSIKAPFQEGTIIGRGPEEPIYDETSYVIGIGPQSPNPGLNGQIRWHIGTDGTCGYNGGGWNFDDSNIEINEEQWNNITTTYDGDNAFIYLDGVNVNTFSHCGNINQNNHNITIGKMYEDYHFNGKIDEIRIWNRIISQSEFNNFNEENQDNLLAHFKFNSGSGDILYDHSGNGNHGTIHGATWVENIEGCTDELAANYNPDANIDDSSCNYEFGEYYLEFNGYGYHESGISEVSIANLDSSDFSRTFNFDFFAKDTGLGNIIDSHSGADENGHVYSLEILPSGNQFIPRIVYYSQPGTYIYWDGDITLDFNQWYDISMQIDIEGNVFLEVNNESVNMVEILFNSSISIMFDDFIKIGHFNGYVDNFQIYNQDGLLGDYTFNSGQGDILYDHSGNGNHGEINGATWVESISGCTDSLAVSYNPAAELDDGSCLYDQGEFSLSFDGIDDYVLVEEEILSNSFTVSAWVFPELNSDDHRAVYADYSEQLEIWFGYGFNGKLRLHVGGANWLDSDINMIEYNHWNHIVGLWDGSEARIYANGTLVANGSSGLDNPNPHTFTLGSRLNNNSNQVLGRLDEINLFNYSLSIEEINNLYLLDYNPSSSSASYKFNYGEGNILYDGSSNQNHGTIYGATWLENISGCTDTNAFNYNSDAGMDDGSCIYDPFVFNQSQNQAFYYFETATINNEMLGSGDWVGAFKGDVCVGARQWDTSLCFEDICDIAIMGDDQTEYTSGYMDSGDIPIFKIYDSTNGNFYNAEASLEIPWINLSQNIISNLNVFPDCNGDLGGNVFDDDNDEICNDVDACPLDAENDADGDSLCAGDDICAYDFDNDIDNDGICGDVDICPNDADNDLDNDNVCGDVDVCPGFDDNLDTDTDGIADGCDICPQDTENDIDGDGFCCSSQSVMEYYLDFDGIDDFVSIPIDNIESCEMCYDFSIMFDIRTNDDEWSPVINKDCNNCSEGEWKIAYEGDANGKITFATESGNGSNVDVRSSSSINDDNFHTVACTRNFENGELKLYIDGVLENTNTNIDNSYPIANSNVLAIGGFVYSIEDVANHFGGFIDNLSIWNKSLSASEINYYQINNPLTSSDGLISFWNFNEGQGDTVSDISINNNQGIVYGTEWVQSGINIVPGDLCCYDSENDADSDGICGCTVEDCSSFDVDDCPYDANNDADDDGICGDIDECPQDGENDADDDGICGDVDDCPYDAENDADGDGLCCSEVSISNDSEINILIFKNESEPEYVLTALSDYQSDNPLTNLDLNITTQYHEGGWYNLSSLSTANYDIVIYPHNVLIENWNWVNSIPHLDTFMREGGTVLYYGDNSYPFMSVENWPSYFTDYISEEESNDWFSSLDAVQYWCCGKSVINDNCFNGEMDFDYINDPIFTNGNIYSYPNGNTACDLFLQEPYWYYLDDSDLSDDNFFSIIDYGGDAAHPESDPGVDEHLQMVFGKNIGDGHLIIYGDSNVNDSYSSSQNLFGNIIHSYIPGSINLQQDICCYDSDNDSDSDGVCGCTVEDCGSLDVDVCQGYDDNLDMNANNYPDDCEGCMDGEAVNYEELNIFDDGTCYYGYEIDYYEGANLESFYVLPDTTGYYETYQTDNLLFENYINPTGMLGENASVIVVNNIIYGSLLEIDRVSGYWLRLDEAENITLEGFKTPSDMLYSLHEGNNLVSFPSDTPYNLEDVLPDNVMGVVTKVFGESYAAMYQDGAWIGSLTSLDPFNGYWMMSSEDIDFSYTIPEDGLSRQVAKLEKQILSGYEYMQSSMQSFYFVKDIPEANIGDWIVSYHNDVVVGSRRWDGAMVDIPVMGYDNASYSFGYIEEGDIPTFKLYDNETGELHNLYGSIPGFINNELFVLETLTTDVEGIPGAISLSSAYPNPFNPVTNISFTLPSSMQVEVNVVDLRGRIVSQVASGIYNTGSHELLINGNNLSSGLYFIQLITDKSIDYQKIMLLK